MSDTPYEELIVAIGRVTKLTHEGILRWEKVVDCDGQYRAIGIKPQLVVMGLISECGIKIGDDYFRVHCEYLTDLCREIVKQVGQEETVMIKVVETLDAVLPSL